MSPILDDPRGPKDILEKRFCKCIHQAHILGEVNDSMINYCLGKVNMKYTKILSYRAVELANLVKKYDIESLQENDRKHPSSVPDRFKIQHAKYIKIISERDREISELKELLHRCGCDEFSGSKSKEPIEESDYRGDVQ